MEIFDRRSFFVKASSLAPLLVLSPIGLLTGKKGDTVMGSKLKLSLNAYSFNALLRSGKMNLFDLMEFCAKHDLEAVDPTGYYFPNYPAKPDDEYISRFKRKAYLLGLDISGTGTRNDFTNPDKEKRKSDVEHIKEWILVSEKLGSPLLRVFAGKVIPAELNRNDVNQWVAEGLFEVSEFGRQHGVLIALQNHNEYIKTSDQIMEIMKMVNHEWLGLHLDIGSLRQGDPYKEIEKVVKYAITWQVKELVYYDGKPQKTDLTKIFKIARDAGYRGYLPLETLGEGDPFSKVSALISEAKSALAAVTHK